MTSKEKAKMEEGLAQSAAEAAAENEAKMKALGAQSAADILSGEGMLAQLPSVPAPSGGGAILACDTLAAHLEAWPADVDGIAITQIRMQAQSHLKSLRNHVAMVAKLRS